MSLYIYIIATQLFFFEVHGNLVNGEDSTAMEKAHMMELGAKAH
jgi:hypothetical protein